MSLLFPRVAFAPARCSPVVRHNDFAPLLSLLDDTFNEITRPSRHAQRSFAPRFDVKEAKESYSLEGELPGIDQKDISIEFTDEHTLTIKGRSERHAESGSRPSADTVEVKEKPAVQDGTATPASETGSVKSHQATVEDEGSANVSASTEVAVPEPAKETVKTEQTRDQSKYWVSERSVGEFSRSFSFADRVDQEAVKASLKNGILSILVPKAAKPESRRISIE